MRKPAWVRKSGPFVCSSFANGYILVKPSWAQYGAVWQREAGGGPGFSGRLGLASDLQEWRISVYSEAEVEEGKARVALHDTELKLTNKIYRSDQARKKKAARAQEAKGQS